MDERIGYNIKKLSKILEKYFTNVRISGLFLVVRRTMVSWIVFMNHFSKIFSSGHIPYIINALKFEYLCPDKPSAGHILNSLGSQRVWSFALYTVIHLAWQYKPFHCKIYKMLCVLSQKEMGTWKFSLVSKYLLLIFHV
jgi:hypothetical protein